MNRERGGDLGVEGDSNNRTGVKISSWQWECDYGFEKHTEGVPQFPAGLCVKGLRGFPGTLQTLVVG